MYVCTTHAKYCRWSRSWWQRYSCPMQTTNQWFHRPMPLLILYLTPSLSSSSFSQDRLLYSIARACPTTVSYYIAKSTLTLLYCILVYSLVDTYFKMRTVHTYLAYGFDSFIFIHPPKDYTEVFLLNRLVRRK